MYWLVSNEEDAGDITQEVFLAALKSLEKKPEEITNARAWLFKIARNRAINARKKRQSQGKLFEQISQTQAVSYTVENQVLDEMMLQQVFDYIENTFTEKEKMIFQLRHIHNLDLKEIAEVSGLYFTTVSKILTRLSKQVAAHFKNESDT